MNSGRPRDEFERELFELLPFLLSFARKLAKDATKGEDLYSATVVKLFANKKDYILGSNMKAWAFFIMKNDFYSECRRAWRSVGWDDDFAQTLQSKDNPFTVLELKEVLTAMQFIPADYSAAVIMVAEGLSYEEAAEEAGVETGTMKSRVSRGREMLERLFNA